MGELKNIPHMFAQAVGGAVGHNKISIIIPCHRVVGVNGSLTGYAAGIDRKISLLELEHAKNYTDQRPYMVLAAGLKKAYVRHYGELL